MAGPFGGYAAAVAAALGNPGSPALVELQAAGDAVDMALAGPADPLLDAKLQRWQAAGDALRRDLVRYLLAGVPLADLPVLDAGQVWNVAAGLELDVTIGPLSMHAHSPTVQASGPAGPVQVGPLPPDTFSARIDVTALQGTGALHELSDGLAGLLSARLGVVEAAALASLRRVGGEPAFLVVFAAGFTPGLQLSFGFQISRLGGVFGINRRIDVPALSAKVRDGTAAEVLFPLDVGASGTRALAGAEQLFPPAPGQVVLGPTVRLSWLEVSGTGFFSVDIAVLIELPGPQRIVVAGVARAGIDGVLRLRIDIAGGIDFPGRLLWIDASLIDSGLLGVFSIYGDAAHRMRWGAGAYVVLTMGGFFPGFRPEPAQLPPLRRLGLHLDPPTPGITIRAEGYFAVTSNTIQFGGSLEAGIEAAGCGASGFIGVDAIVQFSPFQFHAEVHAGLRVKVFGLTFCGVSFDGTLDGPGPLRLHGRMTVETFLKDFHFDETFTIGSAQPQPLPQPKRVAEVLRDTCFGPTSLRAVGGVDDAVAPARLEVPAGFALVAPRGAIEWSQHRVPLGIPVDRLDGAPLGGVQQVTASTVDRIGDVRDLFAPGSFITLSGTAEQLNRPAYEELPSGLRVGTSATDPGGSKEQPIKPAIYRKVAGEAPWASVVSNHATLSFPGILSSRDADHRLPPIPATTTAQVSVTSIAWNSSHDGAVHDSATAAFQAARYAGAGAFAVAAADAATPVVVAGV
jgi:hypothetical protein